MVTSTGERLSLLFVLSRVRAAEPTPGIAYFNSVILLRIVFVSSQISIVKSTLVHPTSLVGSEGLLA